MSFMRSYLVTIVINFHQIYKNVHFFSPYPLRVKTSSTCFSFFLFAAQTKFSFSFVISVCEDDPNYADKCAEKAAIKDYCVDQKKFMEKECPKSCGFCP